MVTTIDGVGDAASITAQPQSQSQPVQQQPRKSAALITERRTAAATAAVEPTLTTVVGVVHTDDATANNVATSTNTTDDDDVFLTTMITSLNMSGCVAGGVQNNAKAQQHVSSAIVIQLSADAAASDDGNSATVAADTAMEKVLCAGNDNNRQIVPVGISATPLNKKLLLCRRFKDSGGILRNFNSLPLFVYATSSSTHATSADGVGVTKKVTTAAEKNDSYDLALCTTHINNGVGAIIGTMDCLPLSSNGVNNVSSGINTQHHNAMIAPSASAAAGSNNVAAITGGGLITGVSATMMVGAASGVPYPHHLNLNHQHPHLLNHHSPYSNNYPLHHSNSSHHHLHSDQTKSLQELQHEVGALLEFRDLVIETFPDLKHKMASISSSTSSAAVGGGNSVNASVSVTNTLTGGVSNSSLASRRDWEPGIRIKRKISQKEPSTSTSTAATVVVSAAHAELSSSSLTRSRSNSHSGKKEPKSGENNNGSVVQDSGFSTETSSSKEGHSASSTNGVMTVPLTLNRLSCQESDDELLNLLDVIHRKSNRLREEVEHLQNYERQNLLDGSGNKGGHLPTANSEATNDALHVTVLTKSSSGASNSTMSALTPKTFREHVERLNKEDIKQLRKERDRLLDKLAEMEAETLTGRIKAAKMSDQVEELISVKKNLEEQLKMAMAQKLELSSRVQQLQQQQQLQSKSSSSQSDYSSQRNFLSSATTVLSTGSGASNVLESVTTAAATVPSTQTNTRRINTFQPVVVVAQQHINDDDDDSDNVHFAFHRSAGSDSKKQQQQAHQLGRLDGIVSTPGGRNTKCRTTDSERITAILLETSVIELQRHLLTLTVQNQVLMQKLEQATKSKTHLAKRLDKSKEDVEDLRFQLEEKNIELEGTKAQLRVLESRIHSSTPSSVAATNSYLHSQNDYETNRSSASTTLMLSRRGITGITDLNSSDTRAGTPISQLVGQMPQPAVTQISTPSMKAMVHLPMDEIQQHSSSTESAHEHEHELLLHHELPQNIIGRLMSTSVGGVSPFEQQQTRTQQGKKFINNPVSSKPSKIPLPGSKTSAYFSGKPPTGRPSTAGRSPPSAHASTVSNASSKSSLSRSTGNLLYSKSPNSLKRADSAQSIRKDVTNSSSLSTNTSRSSTSSSIPMATTPYVSSSATKSQGSHVATTPSPRILQNSPLPKLKRESLTSRVRHLDSLSRVHHHQHQHQHQHQQHNHNYNHSTMNTSNISDASASTTTTSITASPTTTSGGVGNYLVSSTPKPSSIAAQLNATLRKDLQLSSSSFSHGSQQFLRRATGGAPAVTASTTISSVATTTSAGRRFSNSSNATTTARALTRGNQEQSSNGGSGGVSGAGGLNDQHGNGSSNGASDSDSGKVRTLKSTFLGWLKI